MKKHTLLLPAYFGQAVEYFPRLYLRRPLQLVGKRIEVGWQEYRILYPDSSFPWRLNNHTKLICEIVAEAASYRARPVGLLRDGQASRKLRRFRHKFFIPLQDHRLQLQAMLVCTEYRRRHLTEIRHQLASMMLQHYGRLTLHQFMEMAITTDFESTSLILRGRYANLRMIMITKCRIA